MKNIFFAAILLSTSISFAQYSEESDSTFQSSVATEYSAQEDVQRSTNESPYTTETYATPQNDESSPYYHAHKGFYFSTSVGIGYTYLRHSKAYKKREKNHKFTGFMFPYEETRLGGSISNIVSIYGLLGVGAGYGTFEYDSDDLSIDATSIRFAFGLGLDFYPIQDKESPIYGLFVGFSSGLLLDATFFKSKSSNDDSFINIFYRLEVGRDWWFSKRWCLGVAFNYTFGTMDLSADSEESDNYRNHTFGLSVRIAH